MSRSVAHVAWLLLLSGCSFAGTIEPPLGGGGGGSGSAGGSGGLGGTAGAGGSAGELLSRLRSCVEVSNGRYQSDLGAPANIPICRLNGAVFWQADMDIDCDGRQSAQCNPATDPAFMPATSATESNGQFLDAATLPYVVVPLPSSRFDYSTAGLQLGSVAAVIYADRLEYGIFGDQGPESIIGEASYAMAQRLGIDPNPASGGAPSGVAYVLFTGPSGVVTRNEDHDQAVRVGQMRALELLQDNPP